MDHNRCDRTPELAKSDSQPSGFFVKSEGSAARLIEQCAAAYRRLTSYQDAGRVVLSYKLDGQATRDVAPLSVAYEHPNRLALKAYQTTACTLDNRFQMRLGGEAQSGLTQQVVSRSVPDKLDLNWIFEDVIARDHVSAGLAGAPPQLELLLSDRPFGALIDTNATLSMDGQGTENNRLYNIVKIDRSGAVYRLWMDVESNLLRRIELPLAALPPAMKSDTRISDIHLSIEFDKATTNQPIVWRDWKIESRALDMHVRYFVAPPQIEIDKRLGKAIPAFRLASIDSEPELETSQAAGSGQVQLLVWVADHPACKSLLNQIEKSLSQLPEAIRSQVACTAIWAEPTPASGTTFTNMRSKWSIAMPMALDAQAIGRDLFSISEAPSVVILDRKHRLQFFQERANPLLPQALPELLSRLVDGENLAETMQARAITEQRRYTAQLWQARSADANMGAFDKTQPYAPAQVRLDKIRDYKIVSETVALSIDAQQHIWLLTSNGKLECRDAEGQVLKTIQLENPNWLTKGATANSIALSIEPAARFIAIAKTTSSELRIIDQQTGQVAESNLGQGNLVDLRWLDTPGGTRLAAISSSGRTVLFDPSKTSQHGGQSPSSPLAIVERGMQEKLASGYVILDSGRIEPIIIEDQPGALQTGEQTIKNAQATESGKNAKVKAVSTKSAATAEPATMLASPINDQQLKFKPPKVLGLRGAMISIRSLWLAVGSARTNRR